MDKLTDKDRALAEKIIKLREASGRPMIEGGGMVGDTLNFVSARVPPALIKVALVVFIGFHAWEYYNRSQQFVAQVESKRAEALEGQVRADAVNKVTAGVTARTATLEAEFEKVKADAATAQAEAEALGAQVKNGSIRLATLKAEIANTQAEADKAQAEADAQTQVIDGMSLAVAQKKADVAQAEEDAKSKVANIRLMVNVGILGPGGIARKQMDDSAARIWGK